MGIKIGRYHIYLPKMLKPKAVDLELVYGKYLITFQTKNKIPQSGLNFLD